MSYDIIIIHIFQHYLRSNETAGTDVVTAQVFSSNQQVQTGVSLSFITKAVCTKAMHTMQIIVVKNYSFFTIAES